MHFALTFLTGDAVICSEHSESTHAPIHDPYAECFCQAFCSSQSHPKTGYMRAEVLKCSKNLCTISCLIHDKHGLGIHGHCGNAGILRSLLGYPLALEGKKVPQEMTAYQMSRFM